MQNNSIINHIIQNRWLDPFHRTIIKPVVSNDCLIFGDNHYLIDDAIDWLARLQQQQGSLAHITLFKDSWKIDSYHLFRPLLYTCAFGEKHYYQQASLLYQSLTSLGDYAGHFLLLCDNPVLGHKLIRKNKADIDIDIYHCTPGRELDYYLSRYDFCRYHVSDPFQPVLYLDSDVVVDQPLEPTLIDIALASRPCAEPIREVMRIHRSVGAPLLFAEGIDTKDLTGFNSGIIGLPSLREYQGFLLNIKETAERIHRLPLRDTFKPFFDQPVANYVALKTMRFDPDVLKGRVRYIERRRLKGGTKPLGFVHAWGAGKPKDTIARMRQLLAAMHAV